MDFEKNKSFDKSKHLGQSKIEVKIEVEMAGIDKAIEKANRLKELLMEVRLLIDSLKTGLVPQDSNGTHCVAGTKITNPLIKD